MSAIIIDGEVVHYEVLGRGRPIIFLHSWVGSWRYWIPTMQTLSGEYRTYALDLWGFGDTAKRSDRYSLEHQMNLVEGFLREMGIVRIALVGHGLGAVLAMMLARQAPEIVSRIMSVSLPLKPTDISPRLTADSVDLLMEWLLRQDADFSHVRADAPKADREAIKITCKGLETINLDMLARVEEGISSLMVCGQSDPMILPFEEDATSRFSGNTQMMVFQQAGHYPMIDQSNQFTRLLIDFLALESGDTPRELQFKEEWIRRVR